MKLYLGGDVFLKSKNGVNPLAGIYERMNKDDIFVFNLETSCIGDNNLTAKDKPAILNVDSDNLNYIEKSSVISIAHNHLYDFGNQGALLTINNLKGNNIDYYGVKENPYVIKKINNVIIGIVGGYHRRDRGKLEMLSIKTVMKYIRSLRKQVDLLFVSFHWGIEHINIPMITQQKIARKCIDLGADFIWGHHPHVIQGHETYENKHIYYSVGNLNFWQPEKPMTDDNRNGMLIEVEIKDNSIYRVKEHFTFISDDYIPCFKHEINHDSNFHASSRHIVPNISFTHFYINSYKIYYNEKYLIWKNELKKKKLKKYLHFIAWLFLKPSHYFYLYGYIIEKLSISRKIKYSQEKKLNKKKSPA